jgi:hypothetical protein
MMSSAPKFTSEVAMGRRGHSTAIGKFAKVHHDRRVSEIRRLGVLLRAEQSAAGATESQCPEPALPVPPRE